jgi:hypothetical protein
MDLVVDPIFGPAEDSHDSWMKLENHQPRIWGDGEKSDL